MSCQPLGKPRGDLPWQQGKLETQGVGFLLVHECHRLHFNVGPLWNASEGAGDPGPLIQAPLRGPPPSPAPGFDPRTLGISE